MEFSSPGGREDKEHRGVGFVETSKIFATQDTFVFGTEPFEFMHLKILLEIVESGASQFYMCGLPMNQPYKDSVTSHTILGPCIIPA